MKIKSTLRYRSGEEWDVAYHESDPLLDLEGKVLSAVHAYCFLDDKLVVVYSKSKNYWSPPGGGIEPGESYQQAVVREVKEETNMRVTHQELIGFQDIFERNRTVRQIRSFCIVESEGNFVSDPDGDVTEIRIIDPADYKKYFYWGLVGDRIMQKALELKRRYKDSL